MVRSLRIYQAMVNNSEKDGWGDKLRAAERARENQYFAKVDEQLIAKLRVEEATKRQQKADESSAMGSCPRCNESLRFALWRELPVEFCEGCGGLWLDQGDLLQLADRPDVDLHLSEPSGSGTT